MNSFEWREEYSVGVASMDDTHHEFVECVNAMLQADEYRAATATFDKAMGPSRLVKQLEELVSASTVHS